MSPSPSRSAFAARCCCSSLLHGAATCLVSPSPLPPNSSLSLSRSNVRLHFPRSERSAVAVTVHCSAAVRTRCLHHHPPHLLILSPSKITVASAPLPVSTYPAALARSEPRRHRYPSSLLIIQRYRCCPVDAAPPLCLLFHHCSVEERHRR